MAPWRIPALQAMLVLRIPALPDIQAMGPPPGRQQPTLPGRQRTLAGLRHTSTGQLRDLRRTSLGRPLTLLDRRHASAIQRLTSLGLRHISPGRRHTSLGLRPRQQPTLIGRRRTSPKPGRSIPVSLRRDHAEEEAEHHTSDLPPAEGSTLAVEAEDRVEEAVAERRTQQPRLTAEGVALPTAEGVALPTAEGVALPTAEGVALPTAEGAVLPTVEGAALLVPAGTAAPSAGPAGTNSR